MVPFLYEITKNIWVAVRFKIDFKDVNTYLFGDE